MLWLLCARFTDCMPVSALQASLAYSRASIYNGLPVALVDTMHGVMDNRLSSSSWRTVLGGCRDLVHSVRVFILRTNDPRRGGKLAAFALHMTTMTKLVFGQCVGACASGCRARWSSTT